MNKIKLQNAKKENICIFYFPYLIKIVHVHPLNSSFSYGLRLYSFKLDINEIKLTQKVLVCLSTITFGSVKLNPQFSEM